MRENCRRFKDLDSRILEKILSDPVETSGIESRSKNDTDGANSVNQMK